MEESLTLDELTSIINAMREKEKRERQFHAAIQGIDLDKESEGGGDDELPTIDEVKARAMARLSGNDERAVGLAELGLKPSDGIEYEVMRS